MLKFLSTVRRIFLAGTISLILIFVLSLLKVSVPTINAPVAFSTAFTSFAFVSPVLGLVFWLISTIYIRKKGQFAEYQQTLPFFQNNGKYVDKRYYISFQTNSRTIYFKEVTSRHCYICYKSPWRSWLC